MYGQYGSYARYVGMFNQQSEQAKRIEAIECEISEFNQSIRYFQKRLSVVIEQPHHDRIKAKIKWLSGQIVGLQQELKELQTEGAE